MLELRNVIKKYPTKSGDFTALNGISLSFPNTGFIALYGENGCGKTTMLNLISTLDTQYEGEILYNGRDIKTIRDEYRNGAVSVVLQENSFVSYLDIYDNITVFADEDSRNTIDDKLAAFDIAEKKKENPACVSGGQKQRVSLIRGMSKPAEILLVDEPTSALNELMEKEVFEKLQSLAKIKLVILVSHNISLIRQYTDMVIFMDKGTVRNYEISETSKIEYEEDSIKIPETLTNFGSLDSSRVREMIEKHGEIKLSYGCQQVSSFNPDYSVADKKIRTRKRFLPSVLRRKIIHNSLRKTGGILPGLTAMIIVLAVLAGLLCSLANFDKYKFAYESIIGNVEGSIVCKKVSLSDGNNHNFDNKTYQTMKDRYSSRLILLEFFDSSMACDFNPSGIYSPSVTGFAYCGKDDVTLTSGKFADSSSVMITDYLADALVLLDPKYASAEDIFSSGLELGGIHLDVSGIVDTNYEIYKGIYDSVEFTTTQKYNDYLQSAFIYQSIFLPISETSHEWSGIIALQYGEQLAKISVIDASDEQYSSISNESRKCMLSQDLYESFADMGGVKLANEYLSISGVKDGGTDIGTVYVTKETYEFLWNSLLSNFGNIAIELQSADEEQFLEENGMMHNTSMSGYITDCVNIITVLQNAFAVVLIILFAIIAVCSFSIVRAFTAVDRHLIGFMRISGYTKSAIFSIESEKTLIAAIASAVISCLLFPLTVLGLNGLLSGLFGYSISIFSFNILSFAMIALEIIAAFALSLTACIKSFRTELIDMVK